MKNEMRGRSRSGSVSAFASSAIPPVISITEWINGRHFRSGRYADMTENNRTYAHIFSMVMIEPSITSVSAEEASELRFGGVRSAFREGAAASDALRCAAADDVRLPFSDDKVPRTADTADFTAARALTGKALSPTKSLTHKPVSSAERMWEM